MKKYILMSMGAIVASFTFANAQLAASECGCYDAPIGKDVPRSNYVSKEYVDEKHVMLNYLKLRKILLN
jgi:hypothetical protein